MNPPWDQISEHVGRRGESVQKQDRWGIFVTSFPIEDVQIVHASSLVMHRDVVFFGSTDIRHVFPPDVFFAFKLWTIRSL
jgi:hypothetical protein